MDGHPHAAPRGRPRRAGRLNNGGSSWYVFSSSPNKALAIDFLKSTWASQRPRRPEFYNKILKDSGAMGTYLPSQKGSNYVAKDEFFYKSQPVYKNFAGLDGEGSRADVYGQLRHHAHGGNQRHPAMYQGELKTGRRHRRGRGRSTSRPSASRTRRFLVSTEGLPRSAAGIGSCVHSAPPREESRVKIKRGSYYRYLNRFGWLCVAPAMVLYSLFLVYPILSSLSLRDAEVEGSVEQPSSAWAISPA